MLADMLRISLLLAGATVGLGAGHAPAIAQQRPLTALPSAPTAPVFQPATPTPPPPRQRIDVPLMQPQINPPSAQQRLNDTRHSVQQQSCASLGGAAAARCNADVATTIQADRLRQQSIESSQPQPK